VQTPPPTYAGSKRKLFPELYGITFRVGTKRGLASALHSGDPAYDDLPQHLMDQLEPALRTLFARAADGGYARDDVTAGKSS
jgi:hypothetical protein